MFLFDCLCNILVVFVVVSQVQVLSIYFSLQPIKGKGGPKGRAGKSRGPNIPAGLINKALETPQKQRLCWAFNLPNGCNKAKAGESCPKGIHLCAEPGCFKPHSLQDHRWDGRSFTHGCSFAGKQISQIFAIEFYAGTEDLWV